MLVHQRVDIPKDVENPWFPVWKMIEPRRAASWRGEEWGSHSLTQLQKPRWLSGKEAKTIHEIHEIYYSNDGLKMIWMNIESGNMWKPWFSPENRGSTLSIFTSTKSRTMWIMYVCNYIIYSIHMYTYIFHPLQSIYYKLYYIIHPY